MAWESRIELDQLHAIDVHVHAGISARTPRPESGEGPEPAGVRGIQKRIGAGQQTPDETAAYYRDRRIAAVIWGVDPQATGGFRPGAVDNDELLEAACRNSDVLIPFVMVDPWRGHAGALEAERLIQAGARGFKFHPPVQAFWPNDRHFYELYEVLNAHRLPALFHTGQTAVGQGAPGGGGIRLKYGNPMPLDDLAVDFPEMPIIMAHPSFPWQEE
ncbi:MAG TPA: amidohydrolase family protein, partial [Candidatus Dormibacteraeota bacterium]